MCTVTFLPLEQEDFILTSSRDVPFSRKPALNPKDYIEDNVQLHYPKDGEAGGTWIGLSEYKRLICLLNGGFKNHEIKASYRLSRGEIVKDILKTKDFYSAIYHINLTDIEPFTIVAVDWHNGLKLIELVWDGVKRHVKDMPLKPVIWSSSTLYTAEVQEWRRLWFKEWQNKNPLTKNAILKFHQHAGIGDPEIDVLMSRAQGGTVSITQVVKHGDLTKMSYLPIKR